MLSIAVTFQVLFTICVLALVTYGVLFQPCLPVFDACCVILCFLCFHYFPSLLASSCLWCTRTGNFLSLSFLFSVFIVGGRECSWLSLSLELYTYMYVRRTCQGTEKRGIVESESERKRGREGVGGIVRERGSQLVHGGNGSV